MSERFNLLCATRPAGILSTRRNAVRASSLMLSIVINRGLAPVAFSKGEYDTTSGTSRCRTLANKVENALAAFDLMQKGD